MDRPCPDCGRPTAPDQQLRIRGALRDLYRCPGCGTRHFPEPDWLDAVYAEPISELDIGLPGRCINQARIAEAVIRAEGLQGRTHLDWGGGYGLLTRLVRDRGLDMRHFEPHSPNVFAPGFEALPDAADGVVTVVEVLEHLPRPIDMLASLNRRPAAVLIATVLVPDGMTDLHDWWYVGENGQHVTFHTRAGLAALGKRFGYRLTSNGSSVHLLHRRPLRPATRLIMRDVRTSVVLARALRLAQRSSSLRDADGVEVMQRYLDRAPYG